MTRGLLLASFALYAAPVSPLALSACDKGEPLAQPDASPSANAAPSASVAAAPTTPLAVHDAGRVMPPRPVPTSSPTVRITMPVEVQLQAIQYMAAMQAPQPSDAPADLTYAKEIADKLRAVGKPDATSGRRIDIQLEKGCDATLPRESVARYTGASLTTLLAHGVLVVRCFDRQLQCLQSTRDADDVLCTRK